MYSFNEIQNFREINNMRLLFTGSEFPKKLSSARKIIDEGSSAQKHFSLPHAHYSCITIWELIFSNSNSAYTHA